MERIRPYLFWIVLAAAVVALAVLRFGPIGAMYAEARAGGSGLRRTNDTLVRHIKQGPNLPRPALIEAAGKLAAHYKDVLASDEYRDLAMDYQSEFWPPKTDDLFIDFANPPSDPTDLSVKLTNLSNAQQALIQQVRESFLHANADPRQDLHLIELPSGVTQDSRTGATPPALTGTAGLRQILETQRLLWLEKGLYRVITDPAVHVTAVMKVSTAVAVPKVETGQAGPKAKTGWAGPEVGTGQAGQKDIGFPGESSGPYVMLNWDLELEIPLEKIPVLLNRLALSERHLEVRDVGIQAQQEAVVDFRDGSATWYRAGDVRTGRASMRPERRGSDPFDRPDRRLGDADIDADAIANRVRIQLAKAAFRQGRLVVVILKGVSFDFLGLPPGYTGWPT